MAEIDLYGIPKRMEKELVLVKTDRKGKPRLETKITKNNLATLQKYLKSLEAEGISPARQYIYIRNLRKFGVWVGKDYKKATLQDVEKIIADQVRKIPTAGGQQLILVSVKRFYRWLHGKTKGYPKVVEWIDTSAKNGKQKLLRPNEVLSPEEIQTLVDLSPNARSKALIAFLFDSGARIGEALNIRFRDVFSEKQGVSVRLSGKTGERIVWLLPSMQLFSAWLKEHPAKNDSAAFVFSVDGKDPLSYVAFSRLLSKLVRKAKICKRISPHRIRHAAVTAWKRMGMDNQICSKRAGWVGDTRQLDRYSHLSSADEKNAYYAAYGKATLDYAPEEKRVLRTCPRCSFDNPFASTFCNSCGLLLGVGAVAEQDIVTEKRFEALEQTNKEIFALLEKLELKRSKTAQ